MLQRRMRSFVKLQLRNLHPATLPSSKHQASRFCGQLEAASLSESTSDAHRTQLEENAAENGGFSPLISQVKGSKSSISKFEISAEVSNSEETRSTNVVADGYEKLAICRSGVCENAQENSLQHTAPVVHEIIKIIFAKHDGDTVEERLESSGLRFDPSIVEKVLKRSFKKPYAAWRLFNWVKQKDGFCPTTETYHTMMEIMGKTKDFERLEGLMEEMENSSCEKNAKTWRILVSHFGKAKLVDKALMCFEKMKRYGCEPDVKVYSKLIDALCSTGKSEIAMKLYKETVQKKIILNINMYKTLMTCVAKSGDAAAVHSIAEDKIQLVVRTKMHFVFGHMLNSFCSAGKLDEALETIRSIKAINLSLKPKYCVALIKELSEVGRVEEALEIVDMMTKKNLVKWRIYDVIIDGCLRRNDVSKARDLLGAMEEQGHILRGSSYVQLIEKHFGLNQYEKGWEIFNEMLEKGTNLDKEMVMPMFLGCISRNEISEAWRMLRTVKEKGKPCYKFYSAFVDGLSKVGRSDEIIEVLNEIQTSDVVIGNELFERVISYFEKNGDLEKVKHVQRLSGIEKYNPQLDSSSPAQIKVEIRSMELPSTALTPSGDKVEEISRILVSSLNCISLQKALKRHAANYTPETVLEILRNCKLHGQAALTFFDWVGKQDGYSHTTETYETAINIAGSCKSLMHMKSLFYEMKRNGLAITPNVWTILIMQYARKGIPGAAMANFEEMKASGFEPTGNSYKFLIISLCSKNRRVNEAVRLFQEMIQIKHVPSKDLVATLLDCLCDTNRLTDARKCVELVTEVGYSTELSYSLYIRALCRAQKLKQALELVNEIESKGEKKLDSYAYASLVHGFLRRGNFKAASAKVEDMRRAGINPTVHIYTTMMFYFFKQRQTDKAMEIFEKMKAEGCDATVVTYTVMVKGYFNCRKVDEACRVFNEMTEKGISPSVRTYEILISGLCSHSRSEEAVQLLPEMFRNGMPPSPKIYQSVITGLESAGKHDLAREVQHQQQVFVTRRFGISISQLPKAASQGCKILAPLDQAAKRSSGGNGNIMKFVPNASWNRGRNYQGDGERIHSPESSTRLIKWK